MPRYCHDITLNIKEECDVCNQPAEYWWTHETGKAEGFRCHRCAAPMNSSYAVYKIRYDLNTKKVTQWTNDITSKKLFEEAKLYLIRNHPFYGSLLLNMEIIWTTNVPFAGVDGVKLYMNPNSLADFTLLRMASLLKHEVQHYAHLHPFRKRERDHGIWNQACDYAINWLLSKEDDWEEITEGILLDERFADCSPEYIYNVLWQESESQQPDSGTNGGDSDSDQDESDKDQASVTESCSNTGSDSNGGTGDKGTLMGRNPQQSIPDRASSSGTADSTHASGENGSSTSPSGWGNNDASEERNVQLDWTHGDVMEVPDMDAMERDAVESKIRQEAVQAAYNARALGADESIVKAVIESQQAQATWQIQMQNFVSSSLEKDDYTYQKPNRRYYQQDLYMPSLSGTKPARSLAAVVDVSGSIHPDQLTQFANQLSESIQMHPHITFHTFFVNTQIKERRTLTIQDLPIKLNVRGGGGTAFSPAFDAIEEEGLQVNGLIYFTDMECGESPTPPDYPVMWLNFGLPKNRLPDYYIPDFGEVVDMNP